MAAADPKVSAGAREERRALRSYLRRQILDAETTGEYQRASTLKTVLDFVIGRQGRYDRAKGGLGKGTAAS